MFYSSFRTTILLALFVATLGTSSVLAIDIVELKSGTKIRGQIVSRDDKSVVIATSVSGVAVRRNYALKNIKAITVDGNRELIGGASGKKSGGADPASDPGSNATTVGDAKSGRKSGGGPRAELDAQIERVGRTKPDWYDETQLNYPESLDLDWPEPPPEKGWNNQKNVGQFMWDIIHPNPNRWKEGTKLMHQLLDRHKSNPATLGRVVVKLGNMYHDLLEDYERSAFWLRTAGVEKNPQNFIQETPLLAECYWRLGYRDEAIKLLAKAKPSFVQVKLLADLGETDRALKLCEAGVKTAPEQAYFYAGDACRIAGRYREALRFYERVQTVEATGQGENRIKRFHDRAKANIEAIKYFELFDLSKISDGTYKASSLGYEGQIEVTVTVADSKLSDVRVTNHKEKQFYSAISDTPKKILAKQTVKGIDATSNATITSEAIINATAKALGQM